MPDVYVDTDVSPGGTGTSGDPYASWSEAWEAEDANVSGGEAWRFFFRGSTADTSPVSIDGWSGSGDIELFFYPWHTAFGAVSDADDGWYRGDANFSTAHYRLVISNANCVHIDGDGETGDLRRVHIEGLQFDLDNVSSGERIFDVAGNASGIVTSSGNRMKMSGGGAFPRMIRGGSISADVTLNAVNNLVLYPGTQLCSAFNINDSQFTANLINNTVIYSGTGGEDFFDDVSGVTVNAFNNVAYAADVVGDIEFDSAGTLNRNYNASIVSGDRGADGFDVAPGDFTSYGTGDSAELTPAASQTNAWGAGGVTNGDQALIPLTDIRGNARNTGSGQATAIGAFAASGEGAADVGVDVEAAAATIEAHAASVAPEAGTSAAAAALSFATFPAAVAPEGQISAAAGSVAFAPLAATVSAEAPVAAGFAAITLSSPVASVAPEQPIAAAAAPVTVAALPATVSGADEVSVGAASVTLAALPATVSAEQGVTAAAGSVAIEGLAAAVAPEQAVATAPVAVVVTPLPATVSGTEGVAADAASVTLAALPANVAPEQGVAAGVASLSLTVSPASVSAEAGILAAPAAFTITALGATIGLEPALEPQSPVAALWPAIPTVTASWPAVATAAAVWPEIPTVAAEWPAP